MVEAVVPLKISLFILVSKYGLENFGQGNLLKVIILTQGQKWEKNPDVFSPPFLLVLCTVSVKQMFIFRFIEVDVYIFRLYRVNDRVSAQN